jgi:hypothetical protein
MKSCAAIETISSAFRHRLRQQLHVL